MCECNTIQWKYASDLPPTCGLNCSFEICENLASQRICSATLNVRTRPINAASNNQFTIKLFNSLHVFIRCTAQFFMSSLASLWVTNPFARFILITCQLSVHVLLVFAVQIIPLYRLHYVIVFDFIRISCTIRPHRDIYSSGKIHFFKIVFFFVGIHASYR